MKKNFLKVVGISLALGMMVIGCDQDGGGSSTGSITFTDGNYTLVIKEKSQPSQNVLKLTDTSGATYNISSPASGDEFDYTLSNSSGTISSGTVKISGSDALTWTFTPTTTTAAVKTFKATLSGGSLTFQGSITPDKGGAPVPVPMLILPAPGGNTITVINAQVYQENETTPYMDSGVVKIGDFEIGTVDNGKLSFTFPTTVPSQYLESIPDIPSGVTVSPPSARLFQHSIELYSGNTRIGSFTFGKIAGSTEGQVLHVYFDRACSINGSYTNNYDGTVEVVTYSINARAGWNKVYEQVDWAQSRWTYTTSNVPSDLKWVFWSYNDKNGTREGDTTDSDGPIGFGGKNGTREGDTSTGDGPKGLGNG
jgi:hypothetical protein